MQNKSFHVMTSSYIILLIPKMTRGGALFLTVVGFQVRNLNSIFKASLFHVPNGFAYVRDVVRVGV